MTTSQYRLNSLKTGNLKTFEERKRMVKCKVNQRSIEFLFFVKKDQSTIEMSGCFDHCINLDIINSSECKRVYYP